MHGRQPRVSIGATDRRVQDNEEGKKTVHLVFFALPLSSCLGLMVNTLMLSAVETSRTTVNTMWT